MPQSITFLASLLSRMQFFMPGFPLNCDAAGTWAMGDGRCILAWLLMPIECSPSQLRLKLDECCLFQRQSTSAVWWWLDTDIKCISPRPLKLCSILASVWKFVNYALCHINYGAWKNEYHVINEFLSSPSLLQGAEASGRRIERHLWIGDAADPQEREESHGVQHFCCRER